MQQKWRVRLNKEIETSFNINVIIEACARCEVDTKEGVPRQMGADDLGFKR